MFRVASRKSVGRGLKQCRRQSTNVPPKPPSSTIPIPPPRGNPPKSGGGGKGLALVGLTVAGAGGVIGYAYADQEFRRQVEETIPPSKTVFDAVLGKSSLESTKKSIDDMKEKVASIVPKKKQQEEILPPLAKVELPPVSKEPVHVDPVDVRKEVAPLPPKPPVEVVKKINDDLETRLKNALTAAENKVREASEAKYKTITAINNHAKVLKETVDDYKKGDWNKVFDALHAIEEASKLESGPEIDCRNYIDSLQRIIDEGSKNSETENNSLIKIGRNTVMKLNNQIDELNSLVKKARQESIVMNKYKDLIEKSRQQFAMEMKAILPDVDVNAKGDNLTTDELNALITHAHLKVDQLRQQLTEQQVREELNIAKALEEQKLVDERIAHERLEVELRKNARMFESEIEQKVLATKSEFQSELEERLKRSSSAHSEHLEQVLRTQRQLFEIEQNQKIEESVLKERELHSKQVGLALSRLEGIEHALGSRVALDNENRRAKQFWIACHNLIDCIKYGNKAGNTMDDRRLPLTSSLKLLRDVNPEDEFVKSVISSFPKEATTVGTYTEQDLKNRFDKLYKVGRRTAAIDENGGSIGSYVLSYVKSMFLIDLPRKYETESIDVANVDNVEVLAHARHYVQMGDFDKAVRIVQLLRGQSADLAKDWVLDTRAYLESNLLAQLLVAHAAVSSIRSTY